MTNTPKLQYVSVGGTEVLVNKIKENTSAISSEATTARAAEKANADAIAVLNGDSNTEGSIKKAIKDLINAAPEELDTLGEIAEQLNNNENATAAINNVITKHVADAEKQRAELAKLIQANTESIKNNQTAIDTNKLTKITWADLKAKRDAGELIPGVQYRITDYNCTTVQKDTQSAGHQFDIIVTADSNNKLNEVARAIRHDGDENLPDATSTTTDGVTIKTAYFANSKLKAWKIWYCLDNDTSRFAWADATNGKGVIYRMIDEWNNDCPYDFKNIQFKRYKITSAKSSDLVGTYLGIKKNLNSMNIDSNDSKMFYTFSYLGELNDLTNYSGEVLQDASIVGNTLKSNVEISYGVYNNSIKQFYDNNITSEETIQSLNSIVFLTLTVNEHSVVYYGCYSNSFGNSCSGNSFGNDCSNNSFGNDCSNNSFVNDCSNNSFGNSCSSNQFGNSCSGNSFGNGCTYNFFKYSCSNNSFSNSCSGNSFGNSCSSNQFGNSCSGNSFGNSCSGNSFENGCTYNPFGNSCSGNSFGNDCSNNSFGNDCSNNSFGNDCTYNPSEYRCSNNSFGNSCSNNRLDNQCSNNSFGNSCSNNRLNNYYLFNKFENGVQYVQFSGNGTQSTYVQNYHIKQGMVFTSSTKHTITAKTGLTYELSVAKQSDGTVVEYCEADSLKANDTVEYTAADVEALFA